MTKRLFFLLGVLVGFLLTEVMRRKQMEHLAEFKTKEARKKEQYAQYEREWQEELAAMPFEERMDWELFEAALRSSNYQPDWDDVYDDEEDDNAFET